MVIQGIIRPPPEIRAVADRTALYVSKNGRAFEKKILGSEKGKQPKFAFLLETSPFHAYYEDRVQFYENGGEDDNEDNLTNKKEDRLDERLHQKQVEKATNEKKAHKVSSVVDPVAKALLTQRTNIAQFRKLACAPSEAATGENDETHDAKQTPTIPPPPSLHFVNVVAPASLCLAQIETIQLVAQFTALDGKGGPFFSQLSLREWTNPEFGFCQTRHPHFAYFSALVDSYRRVLDVWTESSSTVDGTKERANNTAECLEVAAYRAEYERDQELQKNKQEEAGETANQVDWHNFVVVETIDFPPDETVEMSMLPPPPSQFANLLGAAKQEETIDSDGDDQNDEQIRVVSSYQPKVVATHQQNKIETVIDPITGKRVAVQDMPEHMRIQLLDPKWAEERRKFQEKQKDSNLVSGDLVAINLQRLAQARSDTFGKKELNLLNKDEINSKDSQRVIGHQIKSNNAVGPTLPGAPDTSSRKRPEMSLPVPAPQKNGIYQPDFKRPRFDQVSPSVLPPVPPPAVRPEEAFAAAAVPMTLTSNPTDGLLSEAEFVASLDKPTITLQVRIPNDPSQMSWNFYGQIISVSTDVMTTVKDLKDEIAQSHLNSLPANKIQLKHVATGTFLSNPKTLASLNIGPTATLELATRTRGGRKA